MADSFKDFDPNSGNVIVWGVWDGSEFYCKLKRGGVITRAMNSRKSKLYELTPTGWVLHATKDTDAQQDTCDLCGLRGVDAAWAAADTYGWYRTGQYAHRLAWRWERKSKKITSPPRLHFLCPGCVTRTGW